MSDYVSEVKVAELDKNFNSEREWFSVIIYGQMKYHFYLFINIKGVP